VRSSPWGNIIIPVWNRRRSASNHKLLKAFQSIINEYDGCLSARSAEIEWKSFVLFIKFYLVASFSLPFVSAVRAIKNYLEHRARIFIHLQRHIILFKPTSEYIYNNNKYYDRVRVYLSFCWPASKWICLWFHLEIYFLCLSGEEMCSLLPDASVVFSRPLNAINNNWHISQWVRSLLHLVLSLNALSIFNDAPSSVSHHGTNSCREQIKHAKEHNQYYIWEKIIHGDADNFQTWLYLIAVLRLMTGQKCVSSIMWH
jgi:hypothetical protein